MYGEHAKEGAEPKIAIAGDGAYSRCACAPNPDSRDPDQLPFGISVFATMSGKVYGGRNVDEAREGAIRRQQFRGEEVEAEGAVEGTGSVYYSSKLNTYRPVVERSIGALKTMARRLGTGMYVSQSKLLEQMLAITGALLNVRLDKNPSLLARDVR